jgi:hypothetical protein
MDKKALIVLRADLTTQMALIATRFERLEARAHDFHADVEHFLAQLSA